MIKFACTGPELALITAILICGKFQGADRRTIATDLEACHSNGTPLNFRVLLNFNDVDFFHDIRGIGKAIDRTTGKVGKLFNPRCSLASHPIQRKAA